MRPTAFSGALRLSFRSLLCLTVLSGALWLYTWRKKSELPPSSRLMQQLASMPVQGMTSRPPFDFAYRDRWYTVQPVASYRMSGLVVSHNDPTGFGDIYHDESSVDLRDLCLLFGDNIYNNIHQKVEFWSESWTCNYRTKDEDAWSRLDTTAISNNHLLAADTAIKQKIRSVNLGDQIELEGLLVNYYPRGQAGMVRRSSLRRDDEGNGACEVIFVNQLNVLKRSNPSLHLQYRVAKRATITLIILTLLSFLIFPWVEYRFG